MTLTACNLCWWDRPAGFQPRLAPVLVHAVDQDGVRVENQFYLDPEHKVARKILQYAAAVARNFSRAGFHMHVHSGGYRNPLVISGLPKVCCNRGSDRCVDLKRNLL